MTKTIFDYEKWNTQVFNVGYHDFIMSKEPLDDAIYSIQIEGAKLDILVGDIHNTSSQHCLVVFTGHLGVNKGIPPFFSGVNLARQLNVPLIAISDPSLALGNDLKLAWYAGNYLHTKLAEKIAIVLDSMFERLNYKPVLIGGSGGGFAALVQLSLLNREADALVWNPQTSIAKYNSDAVFNYLLDTFPSLKLEINKILTLPKIEHQKQAEILLKKMGLIYDVSNLKIKASSKLIYLQNISDIHHVRDQLIPFYGKHKNWTKHHYTAFSCEENIFLHVGSWGQGHIAPPVDMLKAILSKIIEGIDYKDIVNNLSYKYDENYNIPIFPEKISAENLTCKINDFQGIKKLEIGLDIQDKLNIEYAVYFINKNERVRIDWYQKSNIFDLPEQEFDKVHLFAKDFFDRKVQKIFLIRKNNIIKINYNEKESIGYNILQNNTWHTPRFGSVLLGPEVGIDWENDPFQNRSWVWLLQQLHFIKDLLIYDNENKTLDGLKFSDCAIKNWYKVFKNHSYDSHGVWHDHGSALRLRRIIEIKNKLIENNLWDNQNQSIYQELIELHVKYLISEKYYSKGTNHGLEQTITLLIAVATNMNEPWSKGCINTCKERLVYETTKMFDKDGGHFENSPHYHGLGINQLMMINTILKKYNSILPASSIISNEFIENVTSILIFMISPLGELVPIGDTEAIVPYEIFQKHNQPKNYTLYEYAITKGKSGVKPEEKYIVLPQTGWVFYRPQWCDERDFYLAAKCGFKSNYHRHDDDTSFVLFYKGEEWVTDSGLYNYHEDDAKRKFVRSHFAHSVSYPKGITPIRNLKNYKGISQVTLTEKSKTSFSFEMKTDIFENFSSKRYVSIDNTFNFSIEDLIISNLVNHKDYETRFIIPADKKIIISDQYIDIIGKNVTLRLSFNLSAKSVSVEDIKISKVFNQLINAKALIFEFQRDSLNVKYDFVWLPH